jgi:SAM-dependent methyltransferase
MKKIEDWHQRYKHQAQWTAELREYLFQQAGVGAEDVVLDVGCGTGALVPDLISRGMNYFGLDIDLTSLVFAKSATNNINVLQADGYSIPYRENTFDLVFCHFFLMWITDPDSILKEMVRVGKRGGVLMVLAEPDYGGRIDYPEALSMIGAWQQESLANQGANPKMGRQLTGLLAAHLFNPVQSGVLGGQWSNIPDWVNWTLEWEVLESDIHLGNLGNHSRELSDLKRVDQNAYQNGTRVLFVPTFYAWGVIP